MTRLTTYLAVLPLAIVGQGLPVCRCDGCVVRDVPHDRSSTSCCDDATERSCCGAPAGQCPCGACNPRDASSGDASPDGGPCLCSPTGPPTATTTPEFQVDHSHGANFAITDARLARVDATDAGLLAAGLDATPARYGGLRIHAYLRVWQI